MHRAGQELLAPVRHRAIPRWWAHWFMEECHRLLQMGRDHLQFRYDGHRCLAGFMEPSWAHLSFPCQPHQFAALESVPQLLNRKPTTGVAVLKQHCYPWCQLQSTQRKDLQKSIPVFFSRGSRRRLRRRRRRVVRVSPTPKPMPVVLGVLRSASVVLRFAACEPLCENLL